MVLDLGLPDIRGEEVLARLRSDPATADLPVVIATSRTLSNDEHESLQLHAGSVMSKSDLNEQLLAKVEDAMATAHAL